MNKSFLSVIQVMFIALLISFTTSEKLAPGWTIDKSHSKISFEVNHFFTPVEGYFNDYKGELNFDPEDLDGSSVNFTVKVSSVKTDSDKRDNHLQSGDFFDAKKFPEMKFASTGFSKSGNSYVVAGNLTIKDVTKSVEIPFDLLGMGDHPFKKGHKLIALKGGLKINRNDFGVGTGSWAATAVVGEEVTVKIVLECNRKG